MLESFLCGQVKLPLDQDPFDSRQNVNKWCSNFPLNPLYKKVEKGKMKERDRKPTSYPSVVLDAPTFYIDVQAPSAKDNLQETKQSFFSSAINLLSKGYLCILNKTR